MACQGTILTQTFPAESGITSLTIEILNEDILLYIMELLALPDFLNLIIASKKFGESAERYQGQILRRVGRNTFRYDPDFAAYFPINVPYYWLNPMIVANDYPFSSFSKRVYHLALLVIIEHNLIEVSHWSHCTSWGFPPKPHFCRFCVNIDRNKFEIKDWCPPTYSVLVSFAQISLYGLRTRVDILSTFMMGNEPIQSILQTWPSAEDEAIPIPKPWDRFEAPFDRNILPSNERHKGETCKIAFFRCCHSVLSIMRERFWKSGHAPPEPYGYPSYNPTYFGQGSEGLDLQQAIFLLITPFNVTLNLDFYTNYPHSQLSLAFERQEWHGFYFGYWDMAFRIGKECRDMAILDRLSWS